jgi:hypothetical protein
MFCCWHVTVNANGQEGSRHIYSMILMVPAFDNLESFSGGIFLYIKKHIHLPISDYYIQMQVFYNL